MRAKKIVLLSLAIVIIIQIEISVSAQPPGRYSKDAIVVEDKDAEVIVSQIFSCPAWDEVERGAIKKVESKIMECLALVSENNVIMIRKAIVLMFSKHTQGTALWSRVFLLNRYLFRVPEKSPIDEHLFGGWVGTPVGEGMVNRLWPFSYDSQKDLQLVGEFEGYFGHGYKGLDEFDYFHRKFGLRKK